MRRPAPQIVIVGVAFTLATSILTYAVFRKSGAIDGSHSSHVSPHVTSAPGDPFTRSYLREEVVRDYELNGHRFVKITNARNQYPDARPSISVDLPSGERVGPPAVFRLLRKGKSAHDLALLAEWANYASPPGDTDARIHSIDATPLVTSGALLYRGGEQGHLRIVDLITGEDLTVPGSGIGDFRECAGRSLDEALLKPSRADAPSLWKCVETSTSMGTPLAALVALRPFIDAGSVARLRAVADAKYESAFVRVVALSMMLPFDEATARTIARRHLDETRRSGELDEERLLEEFAEGPQ